MREKGAAAGREMRERSGGERDEEREERRWGER